MKTSIYYGVNAALYFHMEGKHILIDGLHEGEISGFSPMSSSLDRDLKLDQGIFGMLDAAIFTHKHPDHFSRRKLDILREHRPALAVFAPGEGMPGDLINVAVKKENAMLLSFDIGPVKVYAIRNIHEGEPYYDDPHCSFLLQSEKESYFIGGDAILLPEEISYFEDKLKRPVTAAFVNVYQAASESGKEYLHRLSPKRTFLYHLPMPKDDLGCYHRVAQRLHDRWDGYPPVPEVPKLMAEIEL